MTVKIEVKEGGTPHNTIMWAGLLAAIVCLYLGAGLNLMFNAYTFSFFGGLAAVAAIIWGSNTIKTLCSYGIGTGIPSTGYTAFGAGVIAMLIASRVSGSTHLSLSLIFFFFFFFPPPAAFIGVILGYLANNVITMNILVVIRLTVELVMDGALVLMGLAEMATSSDSLMGLMTTQSSLFGLPTTNYGGSFIGIAIIAVAFILADDCNPHQFNVTLGPSRQQDRMLMLAAEVGFLTMIPVAFMSIAFISTPGGDRLDYRLGRGLALHVRPVPLPLEAGRGCPARCKTHQGAGGALIWVLFSRCPNTGLWSIPSSGSSPRPANCSSLSSIRWLCWRPLPMTW